MMRILKRLNSLLKSRFKRVFLPENFIKAICYILCSKNAWECLWIIFTNNFDHLKTSSVNFSKSPSEIKHELEEITLKVDFDFCNDQEIKSILLKYVALTLKLVWELRVSELILNGFSNSLLASLFSGCSLYIEHICFLRFEDIQDKPLQLDLDGSWTGDLKALVSWLCNRLEMHFAVQLRRSWRGRQRENER